MNFQCDSWEQSSIDFFYQKHETDYSHRLKMAIAARNVSYIQLAKAMGVTYQAVQKVITGKTKEFGASNHFRAAEYLSVNPIWLLEGSGSMNGSEPATPMRSALSFQSRGQDRRRLRHK